MPLPILASKPLDGVIESMRGEFANPCLTCSLRDVCVQGCCASHGDCVQRACNRACNTCGGGDIRGPMGERGTPAVCSKAPLRDVYLNMVRKDDYEFTKRPLIKLKNRGIVVSQGSPGRIENSPYPDDCEAVAVNLRHVWSAGGGWYSQDFRDYLKLPNDKTKLILITSTHDDILERAWSDEVHKDPFKDLGFTYWQALTYSQYWEMSRFNNIWQGYRTLDAIEKSGAHFSTIMPHGLRISGGQAVYHQWLDCGKAIPQLMLNWQYTDLQKDPQGFRWMLGMIKKQVQIIPTKAIWFIGTCTPDTIYNIQRNFPGITCYFLSVVPWLLAHKGRLLNLHGKSRRTQMAKRDLMLQNQANFARLVATAVDHAERKEAKNG